MNTPLLEAHLKALKLPAVLANYQRIAQRVDDPVAYLADVMSVEMERRHENGIKQRIAAARFPTIKTFDSFDFSAQPGLPKMKILELAESRFVDDCRTAVFYGPPGTGKTHCLLAIGFSACTNGHRTLFVTAAGLLNELLDAKRDGALTRKLRNLDRFDLLLIDELGYIPFEREATDLLVQVISQRYERKSLAITTNLAFEQWTQVFPDAMTASAVIDRLIHHGSVFEFNGTSHRLRNRGGKSTKESRT